jgi:DNA-binding response OmpR family regulator
MDSWLLTFLQETARRQNLPLEGDSIDPAWLEGQPRIGAILDRISGAGTASIGRTPRHLAQNVAGGSVARGPYQFFPAEGYLDRDGQQTRLTEKERDILLVLLDASGGLVLRRDLLDSVWGYASGVETHTLETHIYRLRQKIEIDPARPQILLTAEEGYALNSAP